MPTTHEMRGLHRACCRANVTLYLIHSRADGLGIKTQNGNCSEFGDTPPSTGQGHSDVLAACVARHGANLTRRTTWMTGPGNSMHRAANYSHLQDLTHQRRYYDTPQLLTHVDVGIVWRPGHQQGGKIAQDNRPPTRMHWWWSHGIPVIGYPMKAYVDAARRVGYPEDLLNLTTSEQVEDALHRVQSREERSCLQHVAAHGAHVSSPWYTAHELLAAVCVLSERCSKPLQLRASRRGALDGLSVASRSPPAPQQGYKWTRPSSDSRPSISCYETVTPSLHDDALRRRHHALRTGLRVPLPTTVYYRYSVVPRLYRSCGSILNHLSATCATFTGSP